MESINERAGRILRTQLGLHGDDVLQPDTRITDLGADQLDYVEILMALEEEFECAIPDAVAERWATFGDVVAFLSAPPAEVDAGPVAAPRVVTPRTPAPALSVAGA